MVDIADGVEPVTAAHAHRVVDVEPLPGAQADGIEADVVGARNAARRDEQFRRAHLVVVPVEGHDDLALLAAHRGRLGAQPHVDARLTQRRGHGVARERFDPTEQR